METVLAIRYLVVLASLIIFCYQMNIALHHLMSVDTVDSSEYIPISDLDSPPVITICPMLKQDVKPLNDLGYMHTYNLMNGKEKYIKKLFHLFK